MFCEGIAEAIAEVETGRISAFAVAFKRLYSALCLLGIDFN